MYARWVQDWALTAPAERERKRRISARGGFLLDPHTGEPYAPAYRRPNGEVCLAPQHFRLRAKYGGDRAAADYCDAQNWPWRLDDAAWNKWERAWLRSQRQAATGATPPPVQSRPARPARYDLRDEED